MYRTKVIISAIWKNGEDTFTIEPANIITFTRDSDYENFTIPKAIMKLRLDKNLLDKLIVHEDTATLEITGKKVTLDNENNETSSTYETIGWSGEYIYINRSDVNYNKEIDYGPEENSQREDIYKEVIIGLISKEANGRNRQVENRVVQNSKIQSFVVKAMEEYPLLIEPFTYNETIDQLTIPPQDSLSKFISFMNQYKVFYDTPYRFFIDNDCIYLLSSSGRGTKRKGEKFNTVYMKMAKVTDKEILIGGMDEDIQNNRYTVSILVQDSTYNIDKSSARKAQSITAVTDPDKNNSMNKSEEINNAMQTMARKQAEMINNIKSQIADIKSGVDELWRSSVKANHSSSCFNLANKLIQENIGDIVGGLNPLMNKIESSESSNDSSEDDSVLDAMDVQDLDELSGGVIEASTQPAGSTLPVGSDGAIGAPLNKQQGGFCGTSRITRETYDRIYDQMQNPASQVKTGSEEFMNVRNTAGQIKNKGIQSIYNLVLSSTPLQGVSPANFADNTQLMTKIQTMSNNLLSDLTGKLTEKLNKQIEKGLGAISNVSGIVDKATKIKNILEKTETLTETFSTAYENIQKAGDNAQQMMNSIDLVTSLLGSVTGKAQGLSQIMNAATKFFNSNTINVGDMIAEYNPDWANIASGKVKQSISGMLGKLGTNFNPLKVLTSNDLQNGFEMISNLANLGQSGLSSCDISLDIGDKDTNKGVMSININNDNYNILKNIKADIENKQNKLTIVKGDVDPEVFTPNKEFIIHNYDAHGDKDGYFLLVRKVEMYVREDVQFRCSMIMEFFKVKANGAPKQPTATTI